MRIRSVALALGLLALVTNVLVANASAAQAKPSDSSARVPLPPGAIHNVLVIDLEN